MTSLKSLLERGIAEERIELVSLFRTTTGSLRADIWSQPGVPRAQEGEEEVGGGWNRYHGPVICIKSHWGRWFVANEELPRLAAYFENLQEMIP